MACDVNGSLENFATRSLRIAKRFIEKRLYSRSLALMSVVVTRYPNLKCLVKNDFIVALNYHISELEERKRWDDALQCYECALKTFGDCEEIYFSLGNFFLRSGHTSKAAELYRQALLINPDFQVASYNLECAHNLLVERWHFPMLNDRKRNNLFQKAIEKAVNEGHKNVLDIGCGTGILSMFAVNSGANHVYACDDSEVMCNICSEVLRANHMSDKVTLIRKASTELNVTADIQERVSLVVTEIFDAGLFGEHALRTLQHAWTYLLRPHSSTLSAFSESSGKVIPGSATVWVFPIESLWIRKHNKVVTSDLGLFCNGFEGSIISKIDEPYTSEHLCFLPGGYKMLGDPVCLLTVDFNNYDDIKKYLNGYTLNAEMCAFSDGVVDAIAMYFDLHLNEELHLSSAPKCESCWEQAIFPVSGVVTVEEGRMLTADFLCQDHLMLREIFSKDALLKKMCHSTKQLILPAEWIKTLNNSSLCENLSLSLQSLANIEETKLIDISPVPIAALFAVCIGIKQVAIVNSSCYDELVRLCRFLSVSASSITLCTVDDLSQQSGQWDVLIFDPLEESGLLRTQVIENVAFLRLTCLKPGAQLIPRCLKIMGVLLESLSLFRMAQLESNDSVLGFEIKQSINLYQAKLQQGLNLTTLPHSRLSEVVELFSMDYGCTEVSTLLVRTQETDVKITFPGHPTALAFWHKVEFVNGSVMDTSDNNTLYNQAAFILSNSHYYVNGEVCKVYLKFERGTLHFKDNSN